MKRDLIHMRHSTRVESGPRQVTGSKCWLDWIDSARLTDLLTGPSMQELGWAVLYMRASEFWKAMRRGGRANGVRRSAARWLTGRWEKLKVARNEWRDRVNKRLIRYNPDLFTQIWISSFDSTWLGSATHPVVDRWEEWLSANNQKEIEILRPTQLTNFVAKATINK